MSDRLRPAGSGATARSWTFLRPTVAPYAALVFGTEGEPPADFPAVGAGASDAALGHLAGWSCEIRRDAVVLVNPLGEGVYRADLPPIGADWEHQVRMSESCAVYLLPFVPDNADPSGAVDGAAAMGQALAAGIRTSFAADYGQAPTVGRNAPCTCGSGRKYKHCCGRT